MESSAVDVFATKGIEYLLVIGFLLLLVPFWVLLTRRTAVEAGPRTSSGWFRLPERFFFHRGHGWALPGENGLMRVGMSGFAGSLLGKPTRLHLPDPGSTLGQGDAGWRVELGDQRLTMLSPVDGEVVAVNDKVLADPDLAARDPHGDGWLLEVRVPNAKATTKGLLSGNLARAWMDDITEGIRQRMAGELGVVLQDGGVPVSGFAKELWPGEWSQVASEYLLTDDLPADGETPWACPCCQ